MVRIFIVDDDQSLQRLYALIFKEAGFDIAATAINGKDALEKYHNMKEKPDIILMDHRMPVMNGASATREIKHLDPDTRILFISADETVKNEAMDAGALGFLTKPIRSTELFAAIKKHMNSG